MKKPLGFIAALCAAAAGPVFAPSTLAQESVAPAPLSSLVPGKKVYDNAGEQLGTVAHVDGDKVAVKVGNTGIVVPAGAFVQTDQGPALNVAKASLIQSVQQAAKENAAALNFALKVGADVRSAGGSTVLGTVAEVGENSATLSTAEGPIKMRRDVLFVSKAGLAANLTAAQFAEAVRQSKAASATR
ncbi:hypothetical protein FPZ54_08920 [Sphingomonas suaedae]|uniref:Preprotein translocase subunit YajC n=1 Tax=Sphingomonas suaedae TaxID=2599297 RepID=A0A518RFB3_9SPHN|nr:hypothetical protein [Sphingomonas suaedae]QDX26131.1 hypothetical protein FPZ54_08920 [Sphingomonas suaedae]